MKEGNGQICSFKKNQLHTKKKTKDEDPGVDRQDSSQ